MLSEDDLNLLELSDEELALAWDLWFDLAQTTNDDDPAYTHGAFQTVAPNLPGTRLPAAMRATPETSSNRIRHGSRNRDRRR